MGVTYVLDRISSGVAHLESLDGTEFTLPATWLPSGAREGAALAVVVSTAGEDATIQITHDANATKLRAEGATALRESLKRGPAGDLDL